MEILELLQNPVYWLTLAGSMGAVWAAITGGTHLIRKREWKKLGDFAHTQMLSLENALMSNKQKREMTVAMLRSIAPKVIDPWITEERLKELVEWTYLNRTKRVVEDKGLKNKILHSSPLKNSEVSPPPELDTLTKDEFKEVHSEVMERKPASLDDGWGMGSPFGDNE